MLLFKPIKVVIYNLRASLVLNFVATFRRVYNWGEPYHVRSTVKSVCLLACLCIVTALINYGEYKTKPLSVNHAC